MQEAFGVVLVVVVAVAALIAVVAATQSGSAYDHIGKGGLSLNEDEARPEPAGAVSAAVVDEEVRQMLEARNARRERQGKAPIDVEAELSRLKAPVVDAGLAAEVRELVEARNARRVRQGKPPLDVEAEVQRKLRDLGA